MTETWKDIPGWEGRYQVSDRGRVRSLPHEVNCGYSGRRRTSPGRVLRAYRRVKTRYEVVGLSSPIKAEARYVHRLVAAAFMGPCPEGYQTRHLNGDASDNRAVNLAYGTAEENQGDRKKHGTYYCGEAITSAKLTEEQVRYIRSMKRRVPRKDLALEFGVSVGCVKGIWGGRTWRHVDIN